MIYLAESLNGNATQSLKNIVGDSSDPFQLTTIQEKIKTTGSLNRAIEKSFTFIQKSRECLQQLPNNEISKSLVSLVDFIEGRIKQ